MLETNRVMLANGASEEAGASSVDAWNQLHRVNASVTVACSYWGVSFLAERSREHPGSPHPHTPGRPTLRFAAVRSLVIQAEAGAPW